MNHGLCRLPFLDFNINFTLGYLQGVTVPTQGILFPYHFCVNVVVFIHTQIKQIKHIASAYFITNVAFTALYY